MRTAAQETAAQIALKLLQSGRGGGQYTCGFGEGVVNRIENVFFQELSISFMKFAIHE